MFLKSLLAYLHYASFITLIASLAIQLAVIRRDLTIREASIIQKADLWYGIAALTTVATGFIRVIYLEKGWAYYFSNHIFLTKLTLFIIIGLLSIYPTRVFIKWRKTLAEGTGVVLDDKAYSRVRNVIRVEVLLAFILPFLAALMARGIGFVA